MNPLTFSLLMTGVLLNAAAQLLLKAGTNRVGEFSFALDNIVPVGSRLASSPFILGGLACYVVNAVAAWMLFGESLSVQKLIGIGFIVIGVFLVARS